LATLRIASLFAPFRTKKPERAWFLNEIRIRAVDLAHMIRWPEMTTALFTAVICLIAGLPYQSNGSNQPPATFSMDVNRIVIYATVRGNKSDLITDLTKKNFTVKEDGRVQDILEFRREDLPVAIGLIIDNSQSMMNKRSEVIAAATAFIKNSNPQDQIFVLHFADQITFGLPEAKPFSSDLAELQKALQRLTPNGMTALYDAIYEGLKHLNASDLTKKALVVISDGGDNTSKRRLSDVAKAANLSGALVYAIGIYDPADADADPSALRRLTRETGGEAFFPESLSEVSHICEVIAHDLRNQYVLVYAPPSRTEANAYHHIQVSVHDTGRRGLTVTARNGYFDKALN
jgi:Ca-activated chloride channel homolog